VPQLNNHLAQTHHLGATTLTLITLSITALSMALRKCDIHQNDSVQACIIILIVPIKFIILSGIILNVVAPFISASYQGPEPDSSYRVVAP